MYNFYNEMRKRTEKDLDRDEYFNNIILLLRKAMAVFSITGCDTDTADYILTNLFLIGNVALVKEDNNIIPLNGTVGGEPNVLYQGTKWIGANPTYGAYEYTIDKDCYLVKFSPLDRWQATGGLRPLIMRYAQLLSDNIISLNIIQKNSRATAIITAETDSVKNASDNIIQDIYSGKTYKCASTNLLDEVKVNTLLDNTANANIIQRLIELRQYLLAQFYLEIGVDSQYNMKRERLTTDEVNQTSNIVSVDINSILLTVQKDFDKFNEATGSNLQISINNNILQEGGINEKEEKKKEKEEVPEDVQDPNSVE